MSSYGWRSIKLLVGFAIIGAPLVTGVILMGKNDEKQQVAPQLVQQSVPALVPVYSPEYSFDGKYLLIGYGKIAYLWDMETGNELQRFLGHSERVQTVALSPDRKYVLTGAGGGADMGMTSTDDSARLWEVATGKEIQRFEGHTVVIHTVQFSPDGKQILTTSSDDTARLWDTVTGQELLVFSNTYSPSAASFSPNGRIVLGCTGGHRITLWDVQTGKKLTVIERTKNGFFASAVFDSSGTVILTALSDGTARTWDAKSGRQLKVFSGHTSDFVTQAIFTTDERTTVTASVDKTVRLWNASTGAEIKRIEYPGKVNHIILSGDGKRIFARWQADNPCRMGITLSECESGREIMQRPDNGLWEVVGFSPDGTTYLIAKEGKPDSLWDAKSGKMIRQYK